MTVVRKDHLPKHSNLWRHHSAGDFLDCYSCRSDLTPKTAAERAFDMPGWVDSLMRLRNTLVRPLGLKTGLVEDTKKDAIFPITHDSEDELMMGTDDRHLDFRIAVLRDQGRIYMSTWVHPHNLLGRAYLAVVMPFHVAIVKGSVKRIAKAQA